jgi:protoheme IX farnesyltransferase
MRKAARKLFTYSLSYLFVLFMALLADHVVISLGVL